MRICERWMQEGTADQSDRSHPPQFPTSREDRQIVRITVTDRLVTSRTIAQQIESVALHSVSARTIRRHLQQSGLSARRPLLVTHLSATPRWSDSSLETPWREDAEQLRYAPPHWSCTGYYGIGWYWISLSHSSITHCRHFKQPALHLRSVGASCSSLLQGLVTAIFQQDNAQPHVARIIQRFFVWQRVEAAWSAVPQEHIQSLSESMPRSVAAVISNNGGYSGY
ncbi:transposable element Tcb1 transposase [Trichonephila clavipes]|nr:transposable element Tcb1 transposase [Trichonephila clavipes]